MTSTFRARILSAGIWTAGGFAAQKGFQLASNLVLTRLLFPEAFGLMALANLVLIALGMFSDIGTKPAIIQNARGEEDNFLNTAWTIQVIRGFIMWFGACAIAYPAALIYGHDILWPLVSVLGSTAAITGFASISLATSERRLMVRRITLIQLAGQALSLTLTAFMAWHLRSVWALAWGGIAGAIASTVLSHLFLPPHRHKLMWEDDAAQALVKFGRWIFLSTALTFTAGHGLRILQGLLLSPSQLGVLSIAQTISAIPTDLTMQIISMAVFPAICQARNEGHDRMIDVMRNLQAKILILSITGFAAIALIGIPFIHLLYDVRYSAAGPQLVLLALGGAVAIVALPYQNAVMAIGNTRLHAAFMIVNTTIRIVGMVLGFQLAGITGMLLGIGVGSFGGYLFVAYHARRLGMWFPKLDCLGFAALALATLVTMAVYGPAALLVR